MLWIFLTVLNFEITITINTDTIDQLRKKCNEKKMIKPGRDDWTHDKTKFNRFKRNSSLFSLHLPRTLPVLHLMVHVLHFFLGNFTHITELIRLLNVIKIYFYKFGLLSINKFAMNYYYSTYKYNLSIYCELKKFYLLSKDLNSYVI